MYSTNQKSPPALEQQVPTIGIPVSSSNQQSYPPMTQNYPQPASHYQPTAGTGKVPWSSGLCDCCSDVPNCCITCFCPCITFGQIAEIVDQGSTSCAVSGALYGLLCWFTGCGCIYSCIYRSKLRSQYMLEESPCADFCVHCCCETCSLCQEYRELKNRGFDMTLGYHGSMERMQNRGEMPMQGGVPTAPQVEGGMKR